jgi:hypothetical protein
MKFASPLIASIISSRGKTPVNVLESKSRSLTGGKSGLIVIKI